MRARFHWKLFFAATIAWVTFWILGLPDYFQQYSTIAMMWFDVLVLPPLLWIFLRVINRVPTAHRLRFSLWMAFYFTIPLAFYDWLYCGVFLRHGFHFIYIYWYLSIYYVIFWLVLPPGAILLNIWSRSKT